MLSIIGWVVFGWLAGTVANWLMPLRDGGKATGLETIGCGIVGSVIGGSLQAVIGGGGYRPAGLVWSVMGAATAIWIWRSFNEGGTNE